MTRVAALDCGTNSLRLLIADVDPQSGTLVDLDRRTEIVRLGQGVDRTGRFDPDAVERTIAVARFYAALIAEAGAERLRFVATSATRDAANRDEFAAGIHEVLGVEPQVASGAQEAALSFAGATRDLLHPRRAGGDPQPPFCVVDLGGGSTEIVLGDSAPTAALSVDIGCVRITERHLHSDPPTAQEVAAATATVDEALDRVAAAVPLGTTRTLVGLAGSVTTVTAHALGLTEYDSARTHGAVLPVDDVLAACTELLEMDRQAKGALPYMHPGRVDVIGAGGLVWRRVVQRLRDEAGIETVRTSEHDILDGIAWSLAE